jgi:gamma-glutamyltranspeptidase/glutathione hydrolase
MLELAHRQHGKLPWATLFAPAIRLADEGFAVSPRLAKLLAGDAHLAKDPAAAAYFFDANGRPHQAGHLLRNPELAAVLRRIALEGADAFYRGDIAQAIVAKVQGHPTNPGKLALADLAGYQAKQRAPLCHAYSARGRDYRICGFPPPSSGAIAIGQILGILANTAAAALPLQDGLPSADWLHLYTEASRLAFADRAQYVGDPDFVQPPAGGWASLLEPRYLAARARLIGPRSLGEAPAGRPGEGSSSYAPSAAQPEYGTSHISIVDGYGHALAMTSTIEDQFGARQMVRGFLLNNELTDFSFAPADAGGKPVANRVAARQAPAFLDGADPGVRPGHRRPRPERRQPRRRPDHPLHRQDAVRHAGMGPGRPARHRPAELRLAQWPELPGGGTLPTRHRAGAARAWRGGARTGDDQRPAGHPADRQRLVRRRRPAPRRCRAR